MKDWYEKSMKTLELNGMSKRTQESYTRHVRKLVDFYQKTPDQISEKELEDYFLHRKKHDQWSPATMAICYSGIKFFFHKVLNRDWHLLYIVRAKRPLKLPEVLTIQEVRKILSQITTFHNYVYLSTVYSCGLRLQESLNIEVPDIRGKQKMIKIHGKGAKERNVPLPESTYHLLRKYWATHRHPRLIYLHLTNKGQEDAYQRINKLMEGL